EAGAFVRDGDFKTLPLDAVGDSNLLAPLHAVAVLDGVDQGLFKGEFDAENIVVGTAGAPQQPFDLVLNFARLGGVAGNAQVASVDQSGVALGVHHDHREGRKALGSIS